MANLNSINTQSKNSMPTFVSGTYDHIVQGLADKKIQAPILGYCTDKKCMVYVDHSGTINTVMAQEIETLTENVSTIQENLGDIKEVLPEGDTLEDYIETNTETVAAAVADIEDIKEHGATIMYIDD